MYQHHVEAFEFLWTNLAGGTALEHLDEKLNFESGGGCIISHAPGTGKTFLTIVFVQAFVWKYSNCRPMIIAPTSILNTWERESVKWSKVGDNVPFHNLNNVKTERRVILSGTPFQNNFRELYNTLRLAKPSAVTNGNLEFLLKSYYRVESEKEKAEVISGIKDIIKPFVHVHKGNVLPL